MPFQTQEYLHVGIEPVFRLSIRGAIEFGISTKSVLCQVC